MCRGAAAVHALPQPTAGGTRRRGQSRLPTARGVYGFLSEGTRMGLFHSCTSTKGLEQHHRFSGIISKLYFIVQKLSRLVRGVSIALALTITSWSCREVPMQGAILLASSEQHSKTGSVQGNQKVVSHKNRALRISKQHEKARASETPNTFKNCIFQEILQLENFRKTIFQGLK